MMIYVAPSKRLVTRQSHNSFACLHGVSPQHHQIQSHTCVCAHTHKQRETLFQPRGNIQTAAGLGPSANIYSCANRKWTHKISWSKPWREKNLAHSFSFFKFGKYDLWEGKSHLSLHLQGALHHVPLIHTLHAYCSYRLQKLTVDSGSGSGADTGP